MRLTVQEARKLASDPLSALMHDISEKVRFAANYGNEQINYYPSWHTDLAQIKKCIARLKAEGFNVSDVTNGYPSGDFFTISWAEESVA